MERAWYRYEMEAARITKRLCPLCGIPLAISISFVWCPRKECAFKIPIEDFYPSAGWAVRRGTKDNRPVIMPTPESI